MSFSSSRHLYRLLIDSSQWCGAIRKRMRKTFSRVETETLLREATDRSINVNIIFVGISDGLKSIIDYLRRIFKQTHIHIIELLSCFKM